MEIGIIKMDFDVFKKGGWYLSTFIPISMIVTGVIVFICEAGLGLKAEYGRYSTKINGFSAPLAWFLQESPAFLIPCIFLYCGGISVYDKYTGFNLNVLFLFYFMIHYFNRYLVFKFL
jgi:hypothetical protein